MFFFSKKMKILLKINKIIHQMQLSAIVFKSLYLSKNKFSV